VLVAGDISDYNETVLDAIVLRLATELSVAPSQVHVAVSPASVRLTITIAVSATDATTVTQRISQEMSTPTACSQLLTTSDLSISVTAIEMPPTIVQHPGTNLSAHGSRGGVLLTVVAAAVAVATCALFLAGLAIYRSHRRSSAAPLSHGIKPLGQVQIKDGDRSQPQTKSGVAEVTMASASPSL